MKLKLLATLVILSALPYLRAQDEAASATNLPPQITSSPGAPWANTFGVGIQFGEPFGVTAKYFVNDCVALDGAIGWSPDDHSSAEIHTDVLFHDFDCMKSISSTMPVYTGLGLVGRFRNDNHANLGGFRFPIGISYMSRRLPLDFFGEVAPEIFFSPFTRGGISADAGVRFWFR